VTDPLTSASIRKLVLQLREHEVHGAHPAFLDEAADLIEDQLLETRHESRKLPPRWKDLIEDQLLETRHESRKLPPRWKKGMAVRYLDDSDWAWSKGTTAYVVDHRDAPTRPGSEYQVFYTGPYYPRRDSDPIFWTTPNDVEWVPEMDVPSP
jgi:hypothetical protein